MQDNIPRLDSKYNIAASKATVRELSPTRFWAEVWSDKARYLAHEPPHVVDGYHFLSAEQFTALIRHVVDPLRLRAGDRVLECGCGAGGFLAVLRSLEPGLRLAGVDICPRMVELAHRHIPEGELAVRDIRKLGGIDSSRFDCVAAFAVLCYLDDEASAIRALEEMLRVCRPGGTVVLGDTSDRAFRAEATALLARIWHPRAIPEYLYFDRGFFETFAEERGLGCEIRGMGDRRFAWYPPRALRYNVYLHKPPFAPQPEGSACR